MFFFFYRWALNLSLQDCPRQSEKKPDITINGSIPNGKIGAESPSSIARNSHGKIRKARTLGELHVVQFQESTDGLYCGGSGSSAGDMEVRRDSVSPPLMMMAMGGTMTPSRKTMEAMKKVS